MPLASMTGFARVAGDAWQWEAKSVNGKTLDVKTRLPAGFESLEADVRAKAAARFKRGNLQVALAVPDAKASAVQVNEALLDQLVAMSSALSKKLKRPAPTIGELMGLRGVIEVSETPPAAADLAPVLAGLDAALESLGHARAAEGAALEKILAANIAEIERLTGDARDNPSRLADAVRARLESQLAKLLDHSTGLDPQRLHQEAMLLFVRSDIQEELDRLAAHIASARALIKEGGAVGRKLDFLAQEFKREANTLCSKAADASLTSTGLALKAVIDQFREQVQNIE
jgi:uncharacterized protein (TIGR00255 family)